MTTPAIRVDGLGKKYRLTHGQERTRYRTLRDTLVDVVKAPFRKRATTEEFWALNDVSFEVQPGEVVGIIGRNGAGKSTLLKILSRITKPTKGRVEINGRVGSLLEVGTGFHPELTGRENVYLNGAILGMSRREIAAKFDEIVAFAEVEKFLDTPVKRYSSGMYVRLAFAVAAHLEPEILIVDEVLAVGDQAFQKKCLGKMEQVGRDGRTVLFVSHDLNAMATLTQQCVLLRRGQVVAIGPTRTVIDKYLDVGHCSTSQWQRSEPPGVAAIVGIHVRKESGEVCAQFAADEPIAIEFECNFTHDIEAQLAFRLNDNRDSETVFTSSLTDAEGQGAHRFPAGRIVARCNIPRHFLRPGFYHVLAALNNYRGVQYDLIERALSFEVSEIGSLCRFDGRLGVVVPLLHWSVVNTHV